MSFVGEHLQTVLTNVYVLKDSCLQRAFLKLISRSLFWSHSHASVLTHCPLPSTYSFCPSIYAAYFSYPAETEGTQAQGVCAQRGLKIMEGSAQTGEGYQAAAPASTAATGNSAVSGRSVHLCVHGSVCM